MNKPIQYDYTMQSANFSIPHLRSNMQHFYERRDASPHYMPSHSQVQTGRFAEPETNWQAGQSSTHFAACAVRTLPASHLASKVAWSHFALVGEICPQAPLNDFVKSAALLRSFLRLRRVRESRCYVNISLTHSLFLGILETEKEVTQT